MSRGVGMNVDAMDTRWGRKECYQLSWNRRLLSIPEFGYGVLGRWIHDRSLAVWRD